SEGRRYERSASERAVVFASLGARDAQALTEEAIRLYGAGQFPRACEKFGRAAADDPASAARRRDGMRCVEGWGWHALREGRPDEASLLFKHGLIETPDDPGLLKGLGVAAVHAGRPDDAFAPLERAARAEYDLEVRLLLAHLHDRRDNPAQAVVNLRAVLARETSRASTRGPPDCSTGKSASRSAASGRPPTSSSGWSCTSTPMPPFTIWRAVGRRGGSTRGWLSSSRARPRIRYCGLRSASPSP